MIPTIKTLTEALRAAKDPDNLCVFNRDGRRCYSGKVFEVGKKRQEERAQLIEALLTSARLKKMADDCPGILVNVDEWAQERAA